MAIREEVMRRAQKWLIGNFDEETKTQVKRMLEEDERLLEDCFYKDLEFGTGGLRGKIGVGTNRMNIYTVGRATQGLANYLKDSFADRDRISVAIAYDSRHFSRVFAQSAANILSANGIYVYLFDDLRPTPELSFAIRELGCQAGIVITASHNPKEYNGYKVYWEDGAQIISPHDKNIMEYMQKIDYEQIVFTPENSRIQIIGEEIDRKYLDRAKQISLSPAAISDNSNLKIVYTPLHGTGIKLLPRMLEELGFENVYIVDEQAQPDGDFPTVKSPNPENPEAMELALIKAREIDADLVLATDPDADRVGVAVKTLDGQFQLLNGNQVGSILTYYVLMRRKQLGQLQDKDFVVKTIVTTDLIKEITEDYGVELYETLTGFKYIGALIREFEGEKRFLLGAEESYGYLVSDFVRDKDAISSSAMIAEVTAWARQNGMSLFELLLDIYQRYSLYRERLVNLVKEGKEGEEEIASMMERFRSEATKTLAGVKVLRKKDYLSGKTIDYQLGKEQELRFPESNVIQFELEDGSRISIRPSGTEPKIKFYFSVKQKLPELDEYQTMVEQLERKIDLFQEALGI